MAEDFQLGDIVDVDGFTAIIRFIGETEFSQGIWIGVEYNKESGPRGKNDGAVHGVKYFDCAEKYGMFCKPSKPRLIERGVAPPPQRQSIAGPRGGGTVGRPASVASPGNVASPRPGIQTPTRPGPVSIPRGSGTATPTGGNSTPRTGTPTAPARPPISNHGSRTSTPTARPGSMGPPPKPPVVRRASGAGVPAPASGTRTSVGGPPPASNRQSMLANKPTLERKPSSSSVSSDPDPAATPPNRGRTQTVTRKPGQAPGHGRKESQVPGAFSSPVPGLRNRNSMAPGTVQPSDFSSPPPQSVPEALTGRPQPQGSKEIEDLKAKVRVLEKKSTENREKLQQMDNLQKERDRFELIIQKLQVKFQPLQEELRETRKQYKESQAQMEELEKFKAESEILVEMATLDREMAEEHTEYLKSELEALRAKAEELETENEVLKEENRELGGEMSQEEKTSTGWIQMEKQNVRLREALLRLREITQQAEAELKDQVTSLEEDNEQLQKYKEEYEATKEKLAQAEAAVEDLRQQLDTALGAEEMLEELTERNLSMAEHIDELKATIEELESLKELNDELEINHVETEKQMQEELDYKDLIIAEQGKRMVQLDTSNEEAEYTITRFRDLVRNLQSDLEDMRASQQITEAEAEDLSARSRSMMDINMKLQLTAAKAQNKTIDMELKRMEASEAIEHLSIVQMFLPEAFLHERESILALLRFKRVAFKSQLLNTFVKERVQAGHVQSGAEDLFIAACDICDKLTWVSAMCDRFIAYMMTCGVQQFTNFRGALLELDPVERAFNVWIDALRRDDLKEKQCAADLQRTMAVIGHLGEIHLIDNLEGYAYDVQMRVQLMQSHMESTAAAVSHIRTMVQEKATPTEGEVEIAGIFVKKADAIVSHARSTKVVVSKILRTLTDLQMRSLSLTMDTKSTFEQCEAATQKIADYSRALGNNLVELLYAEGETDPIPYSKVQSVMYRTTEKTIQIIETDMFSAFGKELRNLTNLLMDLASTASDLEMTAEFERAPAPWVVRALELKNTKVINVDLEEELRRLKDDILDRARIIKTREQALEEASVKIELLEARMKNVGRQAAQIAGLEKKLEDAYFREKALTETIESLHMEVHGLETEVQRLKKAATEKRNAGPGEIDRQGIERAVATAKEVNGLKADIQNLNAIVNFLREENHALKKVDLVTPNSWLFEPLATPKLREPSLDLETSLGSESLTVMNELITFVTQAKITPLSTPSPTNTTTTEPTSTTETTTTTPAPTRLSWRPKTSTPTYKYWRQREQYETLVSWRDDIVKKLESSEQRKLRSGLRSERDPKVAGAEGVEPVAKVGVVVPMMMKSGRGVGNINLQVRIKDPEGWDEFRGKLGF